MPKSSDLLLLRDKLRVFADERDWNQFHTPKNLCMALMVEVAELMAAFSMADPGPVSQSVCGKQNRRRGGIGRRAAVSGTHFG